LQRHRQADPYYTPAANDPIMQSLHGFMRGVPTAASIRLETRYQNRTIIHR
jgi:hypothetical protein